MTTVQRGSLTASLVAAVLLVACGGSSAAKTATPVATDTSALAAPTPGQDLTATAVADSPAAKLGPTVFSITDYPADVTVQKQGAQAVAAGDVPGLTSPATGFFATVASSLPGEFVNLIAIAAGSNADAAAMLDVLAPAKYLSGLTGGAPDAATLALDLTSAPTGAKGFSYTGTVPASASGQATGQSIVGQVVGWVRGSTYIVLVHGMFQPSTRGIDVTKIASAIDARMAAAAAGH